MKIIPYGEWWRHLLRGRLCMAYRAIFGWRRATEPKSLLLDNIGMKINISELQHCQEYIQASEIYWGRGFWGRFKAQQIRPLLFKDEHELAYNNMQECLQAVQLDLLNETIRLGEGETTKAEHGLTWD